MNVIATTTGFEVTYTNCSNTILYKGLSEKDLHPPKIPTYTDDNGVIHENPFSQKYADAIIVYNKKVELTLLDIMLKLVVVFNKEWYDTHQWRQCREFIYRQNILSKEDVELSFLKFYVFDNIVDQSTLTHKVFLTEKRVYDIFETINIQREGVDIHKAYLKNTVDTQIEIQPILIGMHQLVNPLDEYTSCIESNMNWADWYSGNYTLDQKASCVALNRLNKIRDIHSNDAMQIHAEKESKRKNK